ncbi:hypothetical protein FP2506_12044 [Fulvimarina pelagi HTCC2506]|uniref:Uncharacterized protein n=1 Tax=Fulvimarina pelagi HTCC2506 TaxID=314231 RepID=Q0G1T7_9HYPH|nr:hypothetical protein FP2506_12044 [Fulvimarina pelagi HTCC2506]
MLSGFLTTAEKRPTDFWQKQNEGAKFWLHLANEMKAGEVDEVLQVLTA